MEETAAEKKRGTMILKTMILKGRESLLSSLPAGLCYNGTNIIIFWFNRSYF